MKDRAVGWLLAVVLASGAVLAVVPIGHTAVIAQQATIDYKTLTSNQEKLAACESLIGQMIVEYNRQSNLAAANLTRYQQKFRAYTHKYFNPRMNVLIAERNELREAILAGTYSSKQWSTFNETERISAYDQMYGNKTSQRETNTIATFAYLNDLKAISLDDIKPQGFEDPLEDFTGYTEWDEAGDVTVAANLLTFTACEPRDETFYIRDDKGASHFAGNYSHRHGCNFTTFDSLPTTITWGLSNTAVAGQDLHDVDLNSEDANWLGWYYNAPNYYIWLVEIDGGDWYNDSYTGWALSTNYFNTCSRNTSVGDHGTIYAWICTTDYHGEAGSNLLDLLSLALTDEDVESWRYVWALSSRDLGDNSATVSGHVWDLDLQESACTPPTTGTMEATSVEDTTATLNGNVTAVNDSNVTERGFAWGTTSKAEPTSETAPDDSAYDSSWTETGSWTTMTFNYGSGSYAEATYYYYRAAANNTDGCWGWGDEETFLTKPAPPTYVAATDGVHTDKVVVTWVKSDGVVTGYKVYRDGGLIDTVGDVATYDDTGADAPTVTPGNAVAGDGANCDKIVVSVDGDSANVGTTHTYKLKAYNDTGDSDDSDTDTGYRGVGSLTYQWWRSAACSNATYSELGGATTDPYNDMNAPNPSITANNATASNGTSCSHVTLSANETTSNGDCRWYVCEVSATGATTQNTTRNSGYKGTCPPTYQWWRSAVNSSASYGQIAGGTTDPYNDVAAGAYPNWYYFKATVYMTGATSQNTSADRGYKSECGNVTAIYVYPEYEQEVVSTNQSVWCVAWNGSNPAPGVSVTWNTSGVGSILWSENITGADGRADLICTSNTTGNQTICASGGGYSDCGITGWVESQGEDLPLWFFAILGCAIVGAWYTRDMILYAMALIACGGMVWWVQNSTLDGYIVAALSAIFIMLGGVMIFGMLRRGEFSFVRGGDSE